jgi:hypothetical protein
MRSAIYTLLIDLSKAYKPCRVKGVYPPKLNLSKEQTQEEMFTELIKMINFMKNPEYSYMMKDKNGY